MKIFLFALFLPIHFAILSHAYPPPKEGCPEMVDVHPCTCSNDPFTVLKCASLRDSEVLRKVINNSTGHTYQEVHIEHTVMAFLPHEILEKVPIQELYLDDVILSQLFDSSPDSMSASSHLHILHLERMKLHRGISWKLLENLNNLRVLEIYHNNIRVIGDEFNKYTSKNLQQITFHDTKTRTIKPGAFDGFKYLEKVVIQECPLIELNRDIFPAPFNVIEISFNNNDLKKLPENMFTDMPYLKTVYLKNNKLSLLPASTFQDSLSFLEHIRLEGNPIICDCRLAWILEEKPDAVTGKCAFPSKYRGKYIQTLNPSKFNCN